MSAAPAHGSLGSSMPSCFAPVSALGFPTQRRVVEGRRGQEYGSGGGGVLKERQEREKKGRMRRKRRSAGEERKERKDVA